MWKSYGEMPRRGISAIPYFVFVSRCGHSGYGGYGGYFFVTARWIEPPLLDAAAAR